MSFQSIVDRFIASTQPAAMAAAKAAAEKAAAEKAAKEGPRDIIGEDPFLEFQRSLGTSWNKK